MMFGDDGVGACYGPEQLKTIGDAFDQAWSSIAYRFGDNALAVEAARLRLASAIFEQAPHFPQDASALRDAALRAMRWDADSRGGAIRAQRSTPRARLAS
jgi:hypothetical protein